MGDASPTLYVLDACSLLNLIASRRFEDLAQDTPARFATSPLAASEVRYVRKGVGSTEREDVDLQQLHQRGILTLLSLATPAEQATFVTLALEMDDGEAEVCALAVHRVGILVTDDQAARRIMRRRSPGVPLLTTSEVIKAWADHVRIDARELARLLIDIEERASFRPGPHDPLRVWWDGARNG